MAAAKALAIERVAGKSDMQCRGRTDSAEYVGGVDVALVDVNAPAYILVTQACLTEAARFAKLRLLVPTSRDSRSGLDFVQRLEVIQ